MFSNIYNKTWKNLLLNRFLNYVKIHSTSNPNSTETPSSKEQWNMANFLLEELNNIGLQNVILDDLGYLYAKIPSNIKENTPKIGFIAHYDTSPDFNGKNINPLIWENYHGNDLLLNKEISFILSPKRFKDLKKYIGKTLITTDGTSLLSADDKAGIAEIITFAHFLIENPQIKHGEIHIAFNPDEEIGKGAHHFNLDIFNPDWAYTIDGGEIGELEYENFNAASAEINIQGISVHPGFAYNQMQNACLIAHEFIAKFPKDEVPELTKEYQGFYHLYQLDSDVSHACLKYIIRDHDLELFNKRKEFIKEKVNEIKQKYGENSIKLELNDQYFNMKSIFKDKMYIVDLAKNAMIQSNVQPKIKAIRGGTDGAQLSFMGIPCPNIFGGGHNFHGPYEFVVLESMQKAIEVMLNIIKK